MIFPCFVEAAALWPHPTVVDEEAKGAVMRGWADVCCILNEIIIQCFVCTFPH